ncbi:MAG: hypothetical protein ABI823_12835 [Bryobacteraceae bacterium]
MKRLLMITAAGMLMTGGLFAGNIARREARQQGRIAQGVRSGSLTRGETRSIERRERGLAREVRRDRLSGGGLSGAERARITRQQNRLSNRIDVLKHNGRTR